MSANDSHHYDIILPDGQVRRVTIDAERPQGQVTTLVGPTPGRTPAVRPPARTPLPRLGAAVLAQVIDLQPRLRRQRYLNLRRRRRKQPVPGDAVPMQGDQRWRRLEAHEAVAPGDQVLDEAGEWVWFEADMGEVAAQRARRRTVAQDGLHRFLDVSETIRPGDEVFDGERWSPCWATLGFKARKPMWLRRRLDGEVVLRAHLAPYISADERLRLELGEDTPD